MKYRLNKNNYRAFEIFGENRLPGRSYFIPYPDRASLKDVSLLSRRYSSSKVRCLNGTWDFKFYKDPSDLPDLFDTDRISFDQIPVPSCWQFQGYGRPFYVNSRYPFPFDPPKIPEEDPVGRVFYWAGSDTGIRPVFVRPENEYNSAGVYRHFFEIEDLSLRYELSFLGVCSCIDLYLNGRFVGYSEGSHNTAEFDLTGHLVEGRNELLAVVRRWCTGSYLECQDMFRNNGIFRDVLLRISGPADIRDIHFKTVYKNGQYFAQAGCILYEPADFDITITLCGHGICKSHTVSAAGGKASVVFQEAGILEWTAEMPNLYDLYFEIPGTCIHCRVGFRRVEIDGAVLKMNGKRLKLKGVNHHDTSPTGGFAMTPEEIERDVRLCREFNIDTIRTSHYPPDPLLLDLCDELGIYVIDEADIETHGAYFMKLPPDFGRISNDPKWAKHYLDRIRALYSRDRLHPCITMWSLGNESGGYYCQDQMYSWIKKRSDLPVHYEGAIHSRRRAYDIASQMYPPHTEVHSVGERRHKYAQLNDRPYFLCEYLHAMGTGPGGGEEYWEEILKYDNLCGGCVWEFADHAVLEKDGRYTYGGDHGEWEHDGNFCVDGLFYPDRKPSTGAYVIRHLYRPLRVHYTGNGNFEVLNTCSIRNANCFRLVFRFSDGSEQTFDLSALPLATEILHCDTDSFIRKCKENGTDALISVLTIDRKTGKELGEEQLVLHQAFPHDPSVSHRVPLTERMSVKNGKPVFHYPFESGSDVLHGADPFTILFRAPTDNDLPQLLPKVRMKTFIGAAKRLSSIKTTQDGLLVTSKIRCGSAVYLVRDDYKPTETGVFLTSTLYPSAGSVKFLPRFGKTFVLDPSFDRVEYYGRCGETYADMKEQFPIRHVSCHVKDMTEPNIRPQESGNRMDCRYVSLNNGVVRVTFTAIQDPFELGIKPYSDRELLSMRHREDEIVSGTYVTLSAFQMGIGTGSCGPQTLDKYCYAGNRPYTIKVLIEITGV